MTPRAMEILRVLADPIFDEADHTEERPDLVCEGGVCWLGCEQVRRSTVNQLLACCAISESNDGGKIERFEINQTGRAIAAKPELEGEVHAALMAGRPFMVTDDNVVEFL